MSTVRLPLLNKDAPVPARRDPLEPPSEHAASEHAASEHGRSPHAHASEHDELMRVGDLAEISGKTVRAIHLYEEMELLKPAARSKGRYRLYTSEALVRIRWIGKLQDLGLSLTDIKAIVKDVDAEARSSSAPSAMSKVRDVYKQKLDATRTQIERLRTLEREIMASLDYLDTCGSSCEPGRLISSCPSCNHHDKEQEVPDLVAGFRA